MPKSLKHTVERVSNYVTEGVSNVREHGNVSISERYAQNVNFNVSITLSGKIKCRKKLQNTVPILNIVILLFVENKFQNCFT
jgi:hypothetical protein